MSGAKVHFFTNQSFASHEIRGRQIAERLGAPINVSVSDETVPENIVFVKTFPRDLEVMEKISTLWFDIVDTNSLLPELVEVPKAKIIVLTTLAARYVRARLKNYVYVLPQHHCNFEEIQTKRWPPKRVGFVGYSDNFDLSLNGLKAALAHKGLEFDWLLLDQGGISREDVVRFYDTIDVQVSFRGPRIVPGMPPELKDPLRVINAASFGIPTVGYPEPGFESFQPLLYSESMEDVVMQCERLKTYEPFFKTDLITRARAYHIDEIVDKYKELFKVKELDSGNSDTSEE